MDALPDPRPPAAAPPVISSAMLDWTRVAIERHAPRARTEVAYPAGVPGHTAYFCDHATRCEMDVAGATVQLRTGDAAFVPAGTPVACRRAEDAIYTRITIQPALRNGAPAAAAITAGEGSREARIIREAARALLGLVLRPDARTSAGRAEAVAIGLIEELASPSPPRAGRFSAAQMARIETFLAANLARSFAVAELAATVGIERHRFSAMMRETTGDTPHRWVLRRRVAHAREMLLAPGGPALADIALHSGFADQAHLTRVFRREVGITPAAFRRGG